MLGAGSGVAIGLGQNFELGACRCGQCPAARPGLAGGHCRQLLAGDQPAGGGFCVPWLAGVAIDPLRIAAGVDVAAEVLGWAGPLVAAGPVLVYSTTEPGAVKATQGTLGVEHAGTLVEATLARIAVGLVAHGVRQLVVAGGETSGACVQALDVRQLKIGPQIDPGVPWCHAHSPLAGSEGLHLSLKSGNFGTDDFFTKAFATLP